MSKQNPHSSKLTKTGPAQWTKTKRVAKRKAQKAARKANR